MPPRCVGIVPMEIECSLFSSVFQSVYDHVFAFLISDQDTTEFFFVEFHVRYSDCSEMGI